MYFSFLFCCFSLGLIWPLDRWLKSAFLVTSRRRCAFRSTAARIAALCCTSFTLLGFVVDPPLFRPIGWGYELFTSADRIHSPRWNSLSRTRDKGNLFFWFCFLYHRIYFYNTINSVPSLLSFLFPSDYPGHFLSFFFFMSSALLAAASFAFTLSLSSIPSFLSVSYSNWSNPLREDSPYRFSRESTISLPLCVEREHTHIHTLYSKYCCVSIIDRISLVS